MNHICDSYKSVANLIISIAGVDYQPIHFPSSRIE